MQAAKPALMLFIVALASGLLLGSVNAVTLPKAKEQERIALMKNLAVIYPEADDFSEETLEDKTVSTVYAAKTNGEVIGYIVLSSTNGYAGEVEVLTGVSLDGTIVNVKIGEHSETPGLGANAANEDFTNQYIGKAGTLGVVKQSPGTNDIQAITSATITSTSVTVSVNKALEYYKMYLSGGGK